MEYRSYQENEVIKILDDPPAPEGKMTVQTIGIAPWGEDHLGFTAVDQAWVDQNTTPLTERDRVMLGL